MNKFTLIAPFLSLSLAIASTISHADEVMDTEVSADNSTVAIALRKKEESRPYVNIYDVNTGKKLSTIAKVTKEDDSIGSMALNYDGSRLAVDDYMDDLVGVWDTKNPKQRYFIELKDVDEVFFKPKSLDNKLGDKLVFGDKVGANFGNDIGKKLGKKLGNIGNSIIDSDKEELVILGDHKIIRSTNQLKVKKTWAFGTDSLSGSTNLEGANMVLSSDFRYIPSTRYATYDFTEKDGKIFFRYESNGDSILVLDTDSKEEIGVIDVQQFFTPNLANPPIADEIWVYDSNKVRIFNTDSLQLMSILSFAPMEVDDIDEIEFSPDGKTAVFVVDRGDGDNRDLLFVDIQKSDEKYKVKKVVKFDKWINTVKYLDNNRLFISGTKTMVWDIEKGKATVTFVNDL